VPAQLSVGWLAISEVEPENLIGLQKNFGAIGLTEIRHTANIAKFPILKDKKALSPCYVPQAPHCPVTKIIDDVRVRLE
jgi:hypothetical protein